jgi:hypothetical protein
VSLSPQVHVAATVDLKGARALKRHFLSRDGESLASHRDLVTGFKHQLRAFEADHRAFGGQHDPDLKLAAGGANLQRLTLGRLAQLERSA